MPLNLRHLRSASISKHDLDRLWPEVENAVYLDRLPDADAEHVMDMPGNAQKRTQSAETGRVRTLPHVCDPQTLSGDFRRPSTPAQRASFTDAMWAALLPSRDELIKAVHVARRSTSGMEPLASMRHLDRLERALDYLRRRCVRGEGWRP